MSSAASTAWSVRTDATAPVAFPMPVTALP